MRTQWGFLPLLRKLERDAANKSALVSTRSRRQPFGRKSLLNERIDWVRRIALGHAGFLCRDERPVILILGALFDPGRQDLFFGVRQFLVRLRWRHHFVRIVGQDAGDQF